MVDIENGSIEQLGHCIEGFWYPNTLGITSDDVCEEDGVINVAMSD